MTGEINRPEAPQHRELESLMQRYQQADKGAETVLAEQLSPRLYQFVHTQVRDRDQALDLLQECWLRIRKARHTYRPELPLLPWIYGIANHVRVDQYRKAQRIARVELQIDDEYPANEGGPRSARTSSPELWIC